MSTTPQQDIVELKAQIASLTSQIELIKRNFQIKSIGDQELGECKSRIDHIEDQLAVRKHYNDICGIATNPRYPPYTPYHTPVPVESKFSPLRWQHCKSHLKD
jgi:hypothetical protein